MAENIAVIGNSESVEYFRALGCDVYETQDGELYEEQFLEVVRKKYKIIFVTEEVFHRYEEMIKDRTQRTFPVVSIIPDIRDARWSDGKPRVEGVAFEELKKAVVRAVGQDISNI